ncbi:MAG: protein kinase [Acidobacteriota bacterium]
MKTCIACGKKWADDARFCSVDGTELSEIFADPLDALIGKVLNRTYKVEAKLGQGGMGAIFRAKHIGIGDLVAIKVISPEHTQNNEVMLRFRREAQAVRRLAHPNAVAVHDFNLTEDGLLFMVMEYVNGITLEQYLKEHTFLLPKRALEIIRPITAALDVAHSLGIIHRDLKPANLMICQDTAGHEQIKVLDFGTARLSYQESDTSRSSAVRITYRGQICGTPIYMSPEQIMEEPITAASDIYAMGVVLYQTLTGTVPFFSKKITDILNAHVEAPPEPPSRRRPELSPEFDAIVLKALEKKPEHRYQTAGAMAEELATTVASVMREQLLSTKTINSNGIDSKISTEVLVEAGVPQPNFNQFVKRENELKRLQSEFLNTIEGKARPTFIIGSPGIGKTELLAKLREWAINNDATVLAGKFFDYSSKASEPLQLFKTMLASMLPESEISGHSTTSFDNIREQLAKHFGLQASLADTKAIDKWSVFEELNSTFFNIAKTRPLLMLIDDLQWADSLSLEYLGYLLRSSKQHKLCFVGSTRTEEAGCKGHPLREWLVEQVSYFTYEKMELAPFDLETINVWLQAVFHYVDINQEDIKLLHKITDGNPFYLGEVIRLLIDSGKIIFQDRVWRGTGFEKVKVPHSIDSIVKYKLESCPEELRQLLSQAAVIGDDFRFELLQLVSNLDEVEMERLLVAGVKAFLLSEADNGMAGDSYRFYQTTIRYVIYEEIPKRQRKRLHSQVAKALSKLYSSKTERVAGTIAYHYYAAGEWEETFKYGVPAVEQAFQQQVMGDVIKLSKFVEEAFSNLESEDVNTERQRIFAEIRLYRLMALMRLAHFEEAEREVKQTHEYIEKLNIPTLHLSLQAISTELCFWGNRYSEGVKIGSAALTLARQLNDEKYLCPLMFYLGLCQARISKLAEALSTFEEMCEISQRSGDRSMQARALSAFGFFNHFCGEWRKARTYLSKALELARACNDRYMECFTLVFWSWVTEYECQLNQLKKYFDEGTKIAHTCGWHNLEGYFYFVAGRSLGSAFEPNFQKAQELLSHGQVIMQETQDLVGQLHIAHAFATAEGRANPSTAVLAKLRAISTTLTSKGETLNNCRTMCEQGEVEIRLEHWDEALVSFQNALRLAESIPFADCQWRAHFGLARYYKHTNDEVSALNHLSLAIAVINRLQQEFDNNEEIAAFMADKQQVYITYAELCS